MKVRKLEIYLLFIFSFILSTPAVFACRAAPPSAEKMIDDAEVIVRAVADRYIHEPKGEIRVLGEPDDVTISLKVQESLKGDSVPNEILLNGYLSETNDFNTGSLPFKYGRSGGGTCSAYEYKKGAEFLLFLRKIDGKYTIRWYPLAPTNEQLRSSNDEWISWVRAYLKKPKS